jgi:hypothetical protein
MSYGQIRLLNELLKLQKKKPSDEGFFMLVIQYSGWSETTLPLGCS